MGASHSIPTKDEEERHAVHVAQVRQFVDKLPVDLYIDGPRVIRETGFPVATVHGRDPDRVPGRDCEVKWFAEEFLRNSAVGWHVHRDFKCGTSVDQILHPCPHHSGWNPDAPDTFFITKPPPETSARTHFEDLFRDFPSISHVKLRAYRERDGPAGHECTWYKNARWTVSLPEFLRCLDVENNHGEDHAIQTRELSDRRPL